MATIDQLKQKYASDYGNLAAAMQSTKDTNTYNELNTLREYKMEQQKAVGDPNYNDA